MPGRPYNQLGLMDWRSGIASQPRFAAAIGFDQGGFNGGALPQTGSVRFFPSDKAYLSAVGNLHWIGARITINIGDDEAAAPSYPLAFIGTVADVKVDGGALTLTLADLSLDLGKPVCPDTFAGTGGAEGGDDATGRVKRRTWGYAFNVEGRLLDKAYSIYEFGDPGRPLMGFPMVKDKGREAGSYVDLAWQGSVAATLTALRNATAPSGGCVRAPSIAAVKWWTTPAGPLTADIQGEGAGYPTTGPDIASAIVVGASPVIGIGNKAEANGWQGAVCGIHCDSSSESFADLLDRLLIPISIAWTLGADGILSFRLLQWGAGIETLAADTIARDATFAPLKSRRLGFQRNYREHSDAEISAVLLTATDATYADGTPIEALKPAVAGADVTAANTAAAIVGQGPGATAAGTAVLNNQISIGADGRIINAGGGQVTYAGVGGKQLGLLDNLFFGSPYFLETSGGTGATLNAFKTILGTANAFLNQGAFATLNSAAYGSSLLTGFGALAPLANIAFGSSYLLESSGGASASLANFKTNLGVASSITGQGGLATASNINNDGQLAGVIASRIGPSPADSNFLSAARMAWTDGDTVQAFKPQDKGANVTESRISSGIINQGFGATASRAVVDNSFVARGANLVTNSDQNANISLYMAAIVDGATFDPNNTLVYASSIWGTDTFALPGRTKNIFLRQSNRGVNDVAADIGIRDQRTGAELRITCGPGDRIIGSVFVAQHRCDMQVYVSFIDGSGNTIVSSLGTTTTSTDTNANILASPYYRRPFAIGVAPAGTAQCRMIIRKFNTYPGQSDSSIWIAGPMLERAGSLQDAPSPYSAGPIAAPSEVGYLGDLDANNTQRNQSASFAGQGSFATLSYLNRSNVSSYLNYNALSLNYTITRQDGTSIVTENLAITQLGIAAGFTNQGALATKNKVGGNDFDVSYNGQGGRVERDGNGTRIYGNNGQLRVKTGF
jgi:hypothetical protein